MEEKNISTSIEILIRVADFESIRIAKYGEKKITYESEEDRIKQEDRLDAELVEDIVRCMRGIPNKLGKKTISPVAAIEEKIVKKIPEWLANNPVPNLAKESAEKGDMKASNEAESKMVKEEKQSKEVEALFDTPVDNKSAPSPMEKPLDLNADDLFNDEDLFK